MSRRSTKLLARDIAMLIHSKGAEFIQRLDDVQLKRMARIHAMLTPSNCWYIAFQLRDYLAGLACDELGRRGYKKTPAGRWRKPRRRP